MTSAERSLPRDQNGIPEIEEEVVLLEDLHVIRPCEAFRDEDGRVGAVVDLVFQGQRNHPDEEKNDRRDHDQCHEKQPIRSRVLRFISGTPSRSTVFLRAPLEARRTGQ